MVALAGGFFGNRYLVARDTKAVKRVLDNNQSLKDVLPKAHAAAEKVAILRYLSASSAESDRSTNYGLFNYGLFDDYV